ncbi:unnamed protein product [Symbiodinium sp. CCMP2456]|nr:unnamed protein product [Symbiodinium sp. CCMP2456]
MRTATIEIGGVKFREQWLLSSVTQPLFCVGKLMRKNGWDIIHDDTKVPCLTSPDGSTRVPLFYKNYSLHARGSIRGVFGQDNITEPAIRALEVTGPWLELNDAFHEVAPQVYARRDNTDCFLDCGDALAHLGVQHRTTVRQDSLGWNVAEFNQDVTLLEQPEAEFQPRRIHQTITIGSVGKVDIDALFNRKPRHVQAAPDDDAMLDDGLPALPEECAGDVVDQDEVLAGIDEMLGAEAEAATAAQQSQPGHIVVDGVELHEGCNLKTIRAACEALGIGKSGGKATLLARIASHLDKQRLLEKHQVEYDATAKQQQPREQRPVETPTPEQVRLHSLSHIPFAPWCEHCLKFQAREDRHSKSRPETRECSVCSFDYCFTERPTGERGQKLICLVAKDSHTGAAIAIPTPAKGGAVPFRFLVAELCKFINFCGHSEIALRSDGEATCRALQQGVKDLRTKLKLVTHLEQTEKGNHQGNPAEQAVDQLRQLTGTLLSQVEEATGKQVATMSPLHGWCWRHAGWLQMRYSRTGCPSSTMQNFLKAFVTNRGHRPASWRGKDPSDQTAEEAPAPEVVEDEGPQTMPYPGHVVPDDTLLSDLAPPPPLLRTPEPPTPSNPSAVTPAHMLPSLTPVLPETASPLPMLVEPSASAGGDEPTAAGGDSAPTAGSSGGDSAPTAGSSTEGLPSSGTVRARPADAPADAPVPSRTKRLRLDAVQTDASGNHLFHQDEDVTLEGEAAEEFLDCGESADGVEYEPEAAPEIPSCLIKPFSESEPACSPAELDEIDQVADQFEFDRLVQLGVMTEVAAKLDGHRMLTTKSVRTWRPKVLAGQKVWLRRSRLVAREYAHLDPERSGLFCPTTSQIMLRVIPALFLRRRDAGWSLLSLDVSDAFLQCDQQHATLTRIGNKWFKLLRMLPGQRDGSVTWYNDFTSEMKSAVGVELLPESPALFRLPASAGGGYVHVDDMLCGGVAALLGRLGSAFWSVGICL